MTGKQIIIDSIDVSGCVCFSNWHVVMTGQGLVINEIENACTTKQKPCTDIKDCIFKKLTKQLQAKEQECEELKEARKNRRCAWKSLEGTFCPEALKQLEFVRTLNTVQEAEIRKLSKTLTEIKEIAETAAKCMYATYSDDYTEGYRWLGSIILQKISECEGNDEK